MRAMLGNLAIALGLAILLCPQVVLADGGQGLDEMLFQDEFTEPQKVYEYPKIEPRWHLEIGARVIDTEDSEGALHYAYPESSATIAFGVVSFPFPHREHLEVDVRSSEEYFGDIRYAYKDVVLFRGLDRSLYHNQPSIVLKDEDPMGGAYDVLNGSDEQEHGLTSAIRRYGFRLKAPNYPFHLNFEGWFFDSEGTAQSRYMLGTGYYGDLVRATEDRDLDTSTRRFTLGANGHLGPVEAELEHVWKEFDRSGDEGLNDYYSESAFQSEGVYEHSVLPEFEGTKDTLRMHSSYTGKLVFSGTLSRGDSRNTLSGAEGEYSYAMGSMAYAPLTNLFFTLRYAHTDTGADSPSSVTIRELSGTGGVYAYDVPKPLSLMADKVILTGRYRPWKRLTLRAAYTLEATDRSNAELWGLPQESDMQRGEVSANLRLPWGMGLKGLYAYELNDGPAYNTRAERLHDAGLTLTWNPLAELNMLVSYKQSYGESDELRLDTLDARDREALSEGLTASCTLAASERVSLTAMFSYLHHEVVQDMLFGEVSVGGAILDTGVELDDMAHVYGISLSYMPVQRAVLSAGVTLLHSEGEYLPSVDELNAGDGIAVYSRYQLSEVSYDLRARYSFIGGYTLSAAYSYVNLNDELGNEYDYLGDGSAHVASVTVGKKW